MSYSIAGSTLALGPARSLQHGNVTPWERRARAVFLFLAGVFSGIDLHIVGTLPVGEAVLLGGFALFQFRAFGVRGPGRPRQLNWLLTLQLVATLALIFSDLWRGSEAADYLRGWMRMILLLVDILAFSLMEERTDGVLIYFQIGLIFSCISLLTGPPLFDEYWKFGFAGSVTVLTVLLCQKIRFEWVRVLGLAGLSALHFALEYRSLALICACTGLALAIASVKKKYRLKTAIVLAVVAAAAFLPAREILLEKKGEGGGRSDVERAAMIEAASGAFIESPLIGQGSWFSHSDVMNRFLDIRAIREADAGGGLGFDPNDAEGVAIHSQTLVALAEGGFFGGSFFLLYDGFILWALWRRVMVLGDERKYSPIEFYVLFSSLYASFMSPFSGVARLHIAFTAVLVVDIIRRVVGERETTKAARAHPPVAFPFSR